MHKSLHGMRCVVTAGPTVERLDPVRFLSNRSSGALGYACARAARSCGAVVTLISGPTALAAPRGVAVVAVESALAMRAACRHYVRTADLIIMAAAVADYRPVRMARQKLKRRTARLTVDCVANPDILAELCRRRRPGQWIVGFALESTRLLAQARRKLQAKGCDLLVANTVAAIGAAQQQAWLLWRDGREQRVGPCTKAALARLIIQAVVQSRRSL
ncbi:MAG: phosphopantothenoylcysteine decarboxylase [Deltaproteobacteria bacterium]|nr:phosphopantothenoylcysteine decarboxylase [Deltaproteobacteria bacterium]